jgi:DNA-binding MarR family transcriptional regulator
VIDQTARTTDLTTELTAALEAIAIAVIRIPSAGKFSLSTATTLSRLNRTGPIRLTDLTAAENMSQPAMTQLVTRLEKDGLAARTPDPDDRRAVLITITDLGREVVAERKRERAAGLVELFDRLTPDEQASITNALPALQRLAGLGGF